MSITSLNEDFCFEDYETVVAIGGNGTILSVLPYIVNKNIKLGIIPCGTANLLAEKLKIPKNINQAVNILLNGTEKLIDVGKTDDSYFVLRVGYGMDADIINGATSWMKSKLGYLAYLIQGIKCIFNLSPKTFEIYTDKKCLKVKASAVIVSNSGNMYGNKFSVAPGDDISDGKLDIFVLFARNFWEFLTVFSQILFNKHKISPNVLYETSNSIRINSFDNRCHIDGETRFSKSLNINLIPAAITVIAP